MNIFIDESGCLGFDFNKNGTSRYFVMTALVCNNDLIQDSIRYAINKTIKNKIHGSGKKLVTEIKGTETSIPVKQYFYKCLPLNNDWSLYSIIINKKTFKRPKYIKKAAHLYNLFVGCLFSKFDTEFNSDTIITLDKSKTKKEIVNCNKDIENIFYTITNGKYRLTINHEISHDNKILQAVDAFCNGIYKKYENNDAGWYDCFKDRIKLEVII